MKWKKEPSEKKKKKKTLKLGEFVASQKKLVPLSSSAPCKYHISEAPLVSVSRKILSSLPQPPPIISPSGPTISIPIIYEPQISEPHTSEPNTSLPPLPQFNLTNTSILVSEATLLNEPIPPPSSTLSSSTYYDLTSNSECSDIPDPTSPTLA